MWSPDSTTTRSGRQSARNGRFWRTASAVPRYQSLSLRPRNGCRMRTPPWLRSRSQGRPTPMWSLSECGRYCVSTATLYRPELTQLESVKSMMRYLPAKGTAGLARLDERTDSRSPCPPAITTATTLRMLSLSYGNRHHYREFQVGDSFHVPGSGFHVPGGRTWNPER